VSTTSGTYQWSFATHIFHNGQPSHGGDLRNFELMTTAYPRGTLDPVVSLLAPTLYLEIPDRNSLFRGVRVVLSLVFCVELHRSLFIFFLLAIVLSIFSYLQLLITPLVSSNLFLILYSSRVQYESSGIYSAVLTFMFSLIPHNICKNYS
jgi:predicted neutral ceramidase superfamily lipid hydrolase